MLLDYVINIVLELMETRKCKS